MIDLYSIFAANVTVGLMVLVYVAIISSLHP